MNSANYNIVIKDFASGALSKVRKSSIEAESAVEKMMRTVKQGGKDATPSIDTLRFRLEKLRSKRDAAFSVKNIRRYNDEIRNTELRLRNLENLPPLSIRQRFKNLGDTLKQSVLPIGGIAMDVGAVTRGFSEAVSTGIHFNKEMSNVKALTGAGDAEFKTLASTARQLGATTAFSAKQAAEGMGFLAMAGYNTNQIITATPHTLALAAAGSIDLGQAADIASNVISQFGLEAEQTGRVADVMAKTITTSNTNMSELGEAMKYLGPTSKSLGVGLEETSAVLGVLANSGLKGSLASRALGSAFTRLSKPTRQMKDSMNALGVSFFDEGQFIGIAGVIERMEGAMQGLTQEQKAAHLSTLFGAEAFQEMNILLDAGSESIRQYTGELMNAGGTAKEIANVKLDNLKGDWTKLKSAVSELALSLYDRLKPILRFTVKAFTSVAQWVTKNTALIKALAIGIGVYTVVSNIAAIGTGVLSVAMKIATVAVRIFNAALAMSPLGWLVIGLSAVAAAVTYFATKTDDASEKVEKLNAYQKAMASLAESTASKMADEVTEANILIDKFKENAVGRKGVFEELKRLHPEIMQGYKNEFEALNDIDIIQNKIIEGIERRARAEAAKDLYKQQQAKLLQFELEERALERALSYVGGKNVYEEFKGDESFLRENFNSHINRVEGGLKELDPASKKGDSTIDEVNRGFKKKLYLASEKRVSTIDEVGRGVNKLDPASMKMDKVGIVLNQLDPASKKLFETAKVRRKDADLAKKAAADLLEIIRHGGVTKSIEKEKKVFETSTNAEAITPTHESIVTGGKKQITLTVNIDKVVENISNEIHEGRQKAEETVDTIIEGITRRISATVRPLISM